jgi:hypothetical protein
VNALRRSHARRRLFLPFASTVIYLAAK